MRIYGSVQVCFWENNDVQKLSDQAKLLAIYLLTGPHSNMLGCFRLPEGYITEDLRWNSKAVNKAFQQLNKIQFLTRDEISSWIVVHNFLKWNAIQNPKQGIGVEKIFNTVPDWSSIIKPLARNLIEHGKYLNKGFLDRLITLTGNEETVFSNCATNKDQKQDQDQDQELSMSGKPDIVPLKDFSFEKNKKQQALLQSQALEVLDFLNQKTGRAYRPADSNLKLIMARLKTGATVMDCRQIIAKKTREWKGNPMMSEYLRPETLFNASKFEQYIGELVEPVEDAINGHN